ncbi:AraC family transcriptional regulator [Amycolatopsis panacis]|uniref:AraC family transcriptional regulator n=1 Tax=Amycolatopsis panacis TaxID=2340917 RepID=A0A419HY87_9PSEU|nr:helix-turn-helix transcriptional regulator [Amycolatopsis panacis]RJQ82161.1 AraC family transcriptional regulator [Amycolatopsis panacis]
MRNVPLAEVDGVARAVLAISTDYPPNHVLPRHRHRRAQFLYGATGSMQVETADGTWTVPTRRAVLIPPETDHGVVLTNVTTRSLYLEPSAVPWFPRRCRAVDVSPMLRELVREAVGMPVEYARRGRDATLISLLLHEISRCVPLPLELPWPADDGLRALCKSFSDSPDVHDPPSRWARELHLSERTLHRLFRTETGLSFARWRERACVLHALPLLAAGYPVATVAARLGYGSPAAFSTRFTRLLGSPPRDYHGPD